MITLNLKWINDSVGFLKDIGLSNPNLSLNQKMM